MILQVFSVWDEKGTVFSSPFFMANKGLAIRGFSDLVKDKSTRVAQHPEDYKLYLIGEFDDNSGQLVSDKPEFLCHGSDFVDKNGG